MSNILDEKLLGKPDSLEAVKLSEKKELSKLGDEKKDLAIGEIQKALTFIKAQKSFGIPASIVRSIYEGSNLIFVAFIDPRYLVSASYNELKFYNLDLETENDSIKAHMMQISCACISSDSKSLASGSSDGYIKIWDSYSRELISSLDGHNKNPINKICFSPDGTLLASGAQDKKIIIWNIEEKTKLWEINEYARSLNWSYNKDLLVTGSHNGRINIWNLAEKKIDTSILGHNSYVNSVVFSPDRKYLVSGSADKTILIWDIMEKRLEHIITDMNYSITTLCFSPDGKILAIGLSDSTIRLWDFAQKAQITTLKGHFKSVASLSFSNDMSLLSSGSNDSSIKLWKIQGRHETKYISENINCSAKCMCLSHNGEYLALGNYKRSIILLNLKTKEETILSGHRETIRSLCFSPDNKFLISGSDDRNTFLWDIATREIIWEDYESKKAPFSVAFSPDGSLYVSGSSKIKLYTLADKTLIWTYDMIYIQIYSLSFSPDGRFLASGLEDKTIKVFSVQKKKEEFSLIGHDEAVSCLKFSHDGRFLASGGIDGGLKLWNMAERKYIWSIFSWDWTHSISFSTDGKFLTTGHNSGGIKVWNLILKKEEALDFYRKDQFNQTTFTPDGKSLIASCENSIMILDLEENVEEFKIPSSNKTFKCITFSEDKLTAYAHFDPFLIIGYDYKNSKEIEIEDENIPFVIPSEKDGIKFNPLSCYLSGMQNRFEYHCAFYSMQAQDYEKIKNPNITISNLKFTLAHFLAFLGHREILQKHIQASTLCFSSDIFGHSPLYYSIKQQHREVTDLLVCYLSEIAILEDYGILKYTTFKSIENDLVLIINSSSSQLDSFFANALLNQSKSISFGSPSSDLPIMLASDLNYSIESDFLLETGLKTPIVYKHTGFCVPTVIGSKASLDLISSIIECENKDIYRTEFIQCIIRKKWDEICNWVYFYTFLLWANLLFLCLLLVTKSLIFFIFIIAINLILIVWEALQGVMSGSSYFSDYSNIIDLVRFFFTVIYGILLYFSIESIPLTWLMMFSNLIRGISGFTAFDNTRYYIRLLSVCIYKMKDFLYIFIYTTIALGLLNMIAGNEQNLTYESLWDSSFELVAGNSDYFHNTSYTQNITFLLAVTINMIIMLNMIISILGDVFDEFQLGAEVYNYSEMAQVIKEIELILSIKNRNNESKYILACMHAYEQIGSEWKGKVMDIRDFMEDKFINKSLKPVLEQNAKDVKSNIENIDQKFVREFRNVDNKIADVEKKWNGNFLNIVEKLDGNTRKIEEGVRGMEERFDGRIREVEGKIADVQGKIDLILSLVSKNN